MGNFSTPPEPMDDRIAALHVFAQLAAGIADCDPSAIREGREILALVADRGSPDILAQVFRGLLKEFDSEQEEWDCADR